MALTLDLVADAPGLWDFLAQVHDVTAAVLCGKSLAHLSGALSL